MAQGRITSVADMTGNMSKLERQVRTEEEAKQKAVPRTKPKPVMVLNKVERKLFNKIVKLNDNFTEADSINLSMLVSSLYNYDELKQAIQELNVFDEDRGALERRSLAYDKTIQQHLSALSISLTQRMRMMNDLTKIKIEEKKLEQMNQQNNQAVNPLMALLEDDDDE
ncbi:hypothetical protein PDK35_10430 [Bacillus cereus group sp. TH153LC]|uniref:hypothetical protein n=1 Tax=Bacillus cereus group sp. TH153LC TaxID=3018059 RepID=UPI0022E1897D|nr:hypothetical protein [Bacillus cereus group sp. TH153LC]MDA1660380.1 hypothetical protein [Bacillus cereus group sp. TH153LC]